MEKNLTSLNNQVLTVQAVTRICLNLKAIAPRSYEKAFKGMEVKDVVSGLMICLSDLTEDQIMIGLNHVRDMGWIPDPAMLRRWCLGQFDFSAENNNKFKDSYHGPNAALVNVMGWLESNDLQITNAEREAYNRCYRAFNHLAYDGSKSATYTAHQAFKENYVEVVKELADKEIFQCVWERPIVIKAPEKNYNPVEYEDKRTYEQKQNERDAIQKIMDERCLTIGEASMTYHKELLEKGLVRKAFKEIDSAW